MGKAQQQEPEGAGARGSRSSRQGVTLQSGSRARGKRWCSSQQEPEGAGARGSGSHCSQGAEQEESWAQLTFSGLLCPGHQPMEQCCPLSGIFRIFLPQLDIFGNPVTWDRCVSMGILNLVAVVWMPPIGLGIWIIHPQMVMLCATFAKSSLVERIGLGSKVL